MAGEYSPLSDFVEVGPTSDPLQWCADLMSEIHNAEPLELAAATAGDDMPYWML